jgi:hypothetical protein
VAQELRHRIRATSHPAGALVIPCAGHTTNGTDNLCGVSAVPAGWRGGQ